jgi:hypothetical protein
MLRLLLRLRGDGDPISVAGDSSPRGSAPPAAWPMPWDAARMSLTPPDNRLWGMSSGK